jgi:abhydrolase domain-containing protein 11
MAADLSRLVGDLRLGPVSLVGHSMGGRATMHLALDRPDLHIDKLVVVDISPLNQEFDVTSSNEWNMEHYFHCLKAVEFDQSLSLSAARKAADRQLAQRIRDPGLRAWLLMNMRQHPDTALIGWRINLDAIHSSFKESIAVFPALAGAVWEVRSSLPPCPTAQGPTLFLGGGESDYIPVADHEQIMESFPAARSCPVQT